MEQLNPFWVTGFVDGEGCFTILISKLSRLKTGIEVRASFSVSQGRSWEELMQKIAILFNQKDLNIRPDEYTLKYETRSLQHIMEYEIPHFDKYALLTNKKKDFQKFKKVCEMMVRKEHLTKEGLKVILPLAFSMNLDNSNKTRRYTQLHEYLDFLEFQ